MVQIKDNVNLGAVPDAGATPLAGALPDTGGGFLAQGLGQVAQVGQSVADLMIQREIETEERRMATVQMQVESATDDFAVALHKDSERAEGFSRRPAAVVLRDWESRWGQFEQQQMAQFIGEGDGIYQQDQLIEALAVKREFARGVLVQAHEKAVVAARDLTLAQDIKKQAANVAKAPDNMVQVMFNFEEGLDEFAPDLTDEDYQKRRVEGLSLVLNSAIQGYLQRDNVAAARSLLAGVDPVTGQRIDIDGFVSAEQRLAYQQDLETLREKMTRHRVLGDYDRAMAQGLAVAQSFIDGFGQSENIPVIQRDKLVDELQKTFNAQVADQTRAADRAERQEEKALKERQQAVFADVISRLNDPSNDLTQAQLDQLLKQRDLDTALHAKLSEALNTTEPRKDDPQAVVELYEDLNNPAHPDAVKSKVLQMYADGLMTKATLDKFRTQVDGLERENQEVKQYRKFVADAIATAGPLAVLDSDTSYRTASALREFNERVANEDSPKDVADDVLARYRLLSPGPTAFPKPRFLARSLDGDRSDLKALEEARQATAVAYQDGRITRA